jgi:uncharacterized RDD family membrane protein YckC
MFVVILVLLIATGLVVGAGAQAGMPEWVAVTIMLVGVFVVLWGYPAGLETVWGRTVGKAALGLRVVTREGAPIGFRHAAIRAALGLVDFYLTLGGGAVVSALLSRRQQRLGDLVAGTLVLRERSAAGRPRAVRFAHGHGWDTYAATLDPAVLSPQDYGAVRAFLMRADALTPDVRTEVAREIAGPLAERLGHVPPPQVTPELFLLCLAVRYQERG